MKRTLWVLFLMILMLAAVPAVHAEEAAAAITFRLSPGELTLEISAESGSGRELVLPDADGVYHLPVGEYAYYAGCPGFASEWGGLRVLSTEAVTLDLALTPQQKGQTAVDSAKASENQLVVFDFLRETMRTNIATACGIMANIQVESGFDPTATWIDTNNLRSYGLCQWNGPRFERLKAFSPDAYFTVEAQLAYLKQELEGSESAAWAMMQGIENTQDGAYQAGFRWAQYFERCARYFNGTDQYASRGELAANSYWPVYMPLTTYVPDLTPGFAGCQLTGYGDRDMLTIAYSQIGRTGAQLGLPAGYAGDWSAVFVLNCARYTGQSDAVRAISTAAHGLAIGLARDWNAAVVYDPYSLAGSTAGSLTDVRRGDLVCCDEDHDGVIDRIDIAAWLSGSTVWCVGAADGSISLRSYDSTRISLILRPKYAEPAYIRQCAAYPSSGTLIPGAAVTLMSLPCSAEGAAQAGAYSFATASVPAGSTLTAGKLLRNPLGQYWYQVTWGSTTGYLYAAEASLTMTWGEVAVSAPTVVPASHLCRQSLVLTGTVTSSLLPLSRVSLFVYPGTACSGTPETGAEVDISQSGYTIGRETLDNNTRMGSLYAGPHKLVIAAEVTNCSSDGLTLSTEVKQYILHQSAFTVTHNWNESGICSGCGAAQSCAHSWTAAVQTKPPAPGQYGESASLCSSCRTLLITQLPPLALPAQTFTLPSQLTVISQNAFAGIPAASVTIPAGVTRIESGAFSGCRNLQVLIFEGDPAWLADDILSGTGSVTIHCASGSRTAAWALRLGYAVVYR